MTRCISCEHEKPVSSFLKKKSLLHCQSTAFEYVRDSLFIQILVRVHEFTWKWKTSTIKISKLIIKSHVLLSFPHAHTNINQIFGNICVDTSFFKARVSLAHRLPLLGFATSCLFMSQLFFSIFFAFSLIKFAENWVAMWMRRGLSCQNQGITFWRWQERQRRRKRDWRMRVY